MPLLMFKKVAMSSVTGPVPHMLSNPYTWLIAGVLLQEKNNIASGETSEIHL
jgi:hypothetical protein